MLKRIRSCDQWGGYGIRYNKIDSVVIEDKRMVGEIKTYFENIRKQQI